MKFWMNLIFCVFFFSVLCQTVENKSTAKKEHRMDFNMEKKIPVVQPARVKNCLKESGECMQYCNAPNIRKQPSNCASGRICCVLIRKL